MRPGGEQVLPHLLLKVPGVGDEGGREQTVPGDGGHLVLEGLAGLLPAVALCREALEQGVAAVHLGNADTRGTEGEYKSEGCVFMGHGTLTTRNVSPYNQVVSN